MKKYVVLFVVLLNGLFAHAADGALSDKQALKLLIENASKLKIENAVAYELPSKFSDLLVNILMQDPDAELRELLVNSGCQVKGAEQACNVTFILAEEIRESSTNEVERHEVGYMIQFRVVQQNGTTVIKSNKLQVDIAG